MATTRGNVGLLRGFKAVFFVKFGSPSLGLNGIVDLISAEWFRRAFLAEVAAHGQLIRQTRPGSGLSELFFFTKTRTIPSSESTFVGGSLNRLNNALLHYTQTSGRIDHD